MFNIMMLLLLLMFIFSVLGVTLFKATAPEYFGDLSNSRLQWSLWRLQRVLSMIPSSTSTSNVHALYIDYSGRMDCHF